MRLCVVPTTYCSLVAQQSASTFAAEDLDSLFGDAHRDVAGFELGHTRLTRERAALRGGPRGFPDQQAHGFDFGRHVGQLEGDRLVGRYRLAEGLALQRVLQRVL